jgi:hypothetical protein
MNKKDKYLLDRLEGEIYCMSLAIKDNEEQKFLLFRCKEMLRIIADHQNQ